MPTKLTEKEKAPKKAAKSTSRKTTTSRKKASTAKNTDTKPKSTRKTAAKTSSTKKQTQKISAGNPLPAEHHENIRIAAYHRWEQRGGIHGFDVEDWLQAETEVNR